MKHNAFIFDLDGTLANIDHRLKYVTTKPANWGAFNKLVYEDPVIDPVARVLHSLKTGYEIVFMSGREGSERCVKQTEKWLADKLRFSAVHNVNLFMRKEKDYRADSIIKLELLKEFVEPNYNVIGVFDDRPQVVKMWKDNGYFVFDVKQTDRDY